MKTMKVLFTTTSILVLILSLLLASCGGSDKDSDSSSSKDKEGPASAPTATRPENPVNGASYDLPIVCNESKEVVSITGKGLDPDPQTHTCKASGAENFSLSLKQGVKFISPNNLTLSSMDEHGNSADKITMVDVPIDTLTLSIESAPMGTSLNAKSYEVSGNCDVGQGDVTVTVETATPVTVKCTEDPAGAYTALLDISGVTADPMSVTVEQNGNTKSLSPSPGNDQNGPASAPTATGPENPVNGASYDLPIVCSEAGEVVSLTGNGLLPNPQTHTCEASGPETFSLNIERGVIHNSNELMLTSTDQYGNPAGSETTVNIPIDTSAIAPTVVIGSSLPSSIEASNAQSFTVEGTCSEVGEPVMVSVGTGVNAVSPEIAPDCTSDGASGGVWTVDLDVTGLNKTAGLIPITADHSTPIGEDATQASQSVTNNFTCPTNFVGVPSLTGYTTNSFCVMKYEAKKDASNNAVSQAASLPYTDINHNNSITKCTDIGAGYDLITNDEWQSIARNIELVGSNWKNSTVGDVGGLSTGHSDPSPTGALAANSDDNNACHETEQTCNSSTWNSQRRTHTLSNGEVVWDMAGNVWEWVKDNNTTKYGSNDFISLITDVTHSTSGSLSGGTTTTSRIAKGQFGPSGDYTSLTSDPWGGLGYGNVNFNASGVLRGGGTNGDSFGVIGVFSVHLSFSVLFTHANFGFRCVHHP